MRSRIFEASQTFWEEEMSKKILVFLREEIYFDLPFLGIALSALPPKADTRLHTFATDGEKLLFSPEQILRVFPENSSYLDRLYLHTVLHCIFSHLWIGGQRQREIWNIACDIAVEYTIDMMDKKCTKRILSFLRKSLYQELKERKVGISASQIYRYLQEQDFQRIQQLKKEFFADDHVFWPREIQGQPPMLSAQKNWNKIARQTRMEQKRQGEDRGEGKELLVQQLKIQKSRRSYRDFLQKFAVLREEVCCDQDTFDMTYYTYGLSLYGNMPLVEPVESKEVYKIRDFVVVVDTSYSTNGTLVQNFLKETFRLLKQQDSFFRRCRLHVMQCDEKVQRDTVIENERALDELFRNFEIVGGGNTDFRPAFAYVEELLEQGEFQHLCGLLYFTDGKGIYPRKKPAYKTAFLFLEEYEEEKVPVWAMRLQLEREEFEDDMG